MSYILFEYSIKALELLHSFKPTPSRLLIKKWYFISRGSLAYKNILSESWWQRIRLSDAYVFQDPETLIIDILCAWWRICS